MTKRIKRSPKSYQRLEAEGWENKEPAEVIDLAIERVRRSAEEGTQAVRTSREALEEESEALEEDIDLLRSAFSDPPPAPASAGS